MIHPKQKGGTKGKAKRWGKALLKRLFTLKCLLLREEEVWKGKGKSFSALDSHFCDKDEQKTSEGIDVVRIESI